MTRKPFDQYNSIAMLPRANLDRPIIDETVPEDLREFRRSSRMWVVVSLIVLACYAGLSAWIVAECRVQYVEVR